ncbi:MAG: exopolysaccharide Pel transporter PelG [Alphaproteobacteria bacterium]|nr:exopolysaccharide Pel transporter PelG [Alphaproteobacteria bacterium]
MAGIGFVLQKLTNKDDLLGVARAYTHAAFAAVGPWVFTAIALGAITLFFSNYFAVEELLNFRIIVIYNFGFSLVLAAPIFMVITRYLADAIHRQDVTQSPSILLLALILVWLLQVPVAVLFYLGYVELPLMLKLSAIANLYLISAIWLLAVFVTALKDYMAVTRAFGIGMLLGVVLAQLLKAPYGATGMLNGFSIGLTWIAFSLVAKIFAEYPYTLNSTNGFRHYFSKYWELAVTGIFYNAAIWIDKWIMWFSPEATVLPSKMRMYPDYDSAMFFAYLTIVPAMSVFMLSVETNFFVRYKQFYFDILEHKPLSRIRQNQQAIIDSLVGSARNFAVVQGTICFVTIVLAARLLAVLNINYMQIGIFRLGCLGAFFQVLMLFEYIILSYFDCRRAAMVTQALFLGCNAIFTIITMHMGFPYYGYGYFLACVVGFVATSVVLFNHLRKLPYHAFITNNNSLRKPFREEAVA